MATSKTSILVARWRDKSANDRADAQPFLHAGTGDSFVILKMNANGYFAVEAADLPEPLTDGWPLADLKKYRDTRRDTAYLAHGARVLVEGEEVALSEEAATELLKGPWGADNRRLISRIREANPPMEELTRGQAILWGSSATQVVMWRVLMEVGLGKALLNFIAPTATEEEKEWAAEQIQKVQDCLPEFDAYFDTVDAATALGITFKEAALRLVDEPPPVRPEPEPELY